MAIQTIKTQKLSVHILCDTFLIIFAVYRQRNVVHKTRNIKSVH